MQELDPVPIHPIRIERGYWKTGIDMTRTSALYHQWQLLEASKCLDNFRIVAGLKTCFKEGYYYTNSDVCKWAEATGYMLAITPLDHVDSKLLLGKSRKNGHASVDPNRVVIFSAYADL